MAQKGNDSNRSIPRRAYRNRSLEQLPPWGKFALESHGYNFPPIDTPREATNARSMFYWVGRRVQGGGGEYVFVEFFRNLYQDTPMLRAFPDGRLEEPTWVPVDKPTE